jgi:ketosteroid isomerase-like protein
MTKQRFAGIVFTLILPFAAQATLPASAATTSVQAAQPAEANVVADTIRAMYAAAQKDDLDAFHAIVTPGFFAFDNGSRFDGDALMKLIVDLHGKGFKAVWTVTEPGVHISGDHAWIAYTNVGSLQMSPTAPVVPTRWLESAVLERQGGRWKIAFFHSTTVATPQPAK